ncbi:MAG: zinc-ribbon domain-containing protein [Chloroflexi bacterium]|nr:MAG: zinc-ribbon domain-containing protein [Chloroflexota bacterium]
MNAARSSQRRHRSPARSEARPRKEARFSRAYTRQVSRACSSCGAENQAAARYCAQCGALLSTRCPRCSAELAPDARFCPSCGEAVGSDAPPEERKLATVLFVDLVDSTKLSDGLDPEKLRSILQAYFSLVSGTVQAWGGTVEKYIGDAVVAVFGVPRVREDDPARAVSAAAEILDRMRDLAGETEKRYAAQLSVRIGVNTGEVIAPTEVRTDRPMVTGEASNVAARLQTAAQPGTVLVGDRTFGSTRALFKFAEPVELMLKGKESPVLAHPLTGRIEGAMEAGPTRNLQARVVGRERELAILGGLLDEAIETRTPQLAVVYGPAGIGKSRLVRELVTLGTSQQSDLAILRGRCPAVGQGVTYWPLAEIVRAACGISLGDSRSQAEEKLRGGVGDVLGAAGVPAADAEATIFALATTAGIDLADNPLDRARPLAVATELARRWPQFLSAMAARRPVVVVIEDLHWASDQVVEMVERLLLRSNGAILLVATARPEFAEAHASFGAGRSEAVSVSLRPLNRTQCANLLAGLLPGNDLPKALEDQILDTAEGNPLFVEEIVSRLIESGALAVEDGRWQLAGNGARMAIPDTIQGLLAARIDSLPEVERRALREAAVVGRVFWEEPVAVAVGATDVSEGMGELERRGLVSMRPTSSLSGQVEYTFKHALIRDVAYGGLPISRRAQAHAAVAEWLTGISADRPEELAELVAFHYQAALGEGTDLAWPADSRELLDVRRRAAAAFIAAGATARKRFAIDRAVELHGLALTLVVGDAERAGALEELGDDHDAAYDGDHALPAWDEAIALRRTLPESGEHVARLAMKAARMAAIRWGGFSVPVEPQAIDRYVDAGLAGAPPGETRAWLQFMRAAAGLRWVAFHREDPITLEERVRAGEEALAYGERAGDFALQANAVRGVGALLLAYGEVARGVEMTRSLLPLVHQIPDPRERHLVTIEIAQTLIWIGGEPEAMVPILGDALRLARELRVHDVCHSTGTLMSALYIAGRWDEIPACLDEHIRTFKTDDAGTTCPFALGAFQLGATVLAQRGDVERAREVASAMPRSEAPVGIVEGLQAMVANALGDPATGREIAATVLATGRRNFAEEPPVELAAMLDALVALHDWDGLRDFLPEARQRAGELAIAGPSADRAEGLAEAASGHVDRAQELLARAIEAFDRVSPFEAARTRDALAALEPQGRETLLVAALETFERLGAEPDAARVREAVGKGPTPAR